MRIVLPQQTLTRPLNSVRPLTVIRHRRECYIVSGSKDPSSDFHHDEEEQGNDDIICLNIQTGLIENLSASLEVELMESDLNVRDVICVPTQEVSPHLLPLSSEELEHIRCTRKIQAVNCVRKRTGLGLKGAKDLVDAEAARMGF